MTTDPDTGEVQAFTVYVDDAALRAWERHRRRLRAAGYPDRPPEVDTPSGRLWTLDGRRMLPIVGADASMRLGVDQSAIGLGSWRSTLVGGDFGIKLNIGRRGNGVFVFHLVAESLGGYRQDLTAEATTLEAVDERVRSFASLARELGLPEPTWVSTDAMLAEMSASVTRVGASEDAE